MAEDLQARYNELNGQMARAVEDMRKAEESKNIMAYDEARSAYMLSALGMVMVQNHVIISHLASIEKRLDESGVSRDGRQA